MDVAKDKVDLAVLGEKQEKQLDHTQEGIKELVQQMQALQPELIVVEATGGTNALLWRHCSMLGSVWRWGTQRG
jgi:hypothetical protein